MDGTRRKDFIVRFLFSIAMTVFVVIGTIVVIRYLMGIYR